MICYVVYLVFRTYKTSKKKKKSESEAPDSVETESLPPDDAGGIRLLSDSRKFLKPEDPEMKFAKQTKPDLLAHRKKVSTAASQVLFKRRELK